MCFIGDLISSISYSCELICDKFSLQNCVIIITVLHIDFDKKKRKKEVF